MEILPVFRLPGHSFLPLNAVFLKALMDHLEDLVSSLCPFRWVWDWHLGLCNPFKTLWFSSKQKKSQWGVWEQTAMSDAEWPGEGITFCKDGHSQCRPEEGDGVAGRGHLGSRVFGSNVLEWGELRTNCKRQFKSQLWFCLMFGPYQTQVSVAEPFWLHPHSRKFLK